MTQTTCSKCNYMETSETIIPTPQGAHVPVLYVEEHAARTSVVQNPYPGGYFRREYSVYYTDAAGVETVIGSVASFSDGSGWNALSVVRGGPNDTPRSTTTRTRKSAVEFLVATAAGIRWHS